MNAQYPGARWHPSPNLWRGRDGCRVDGIVLHGSAGGDGAAVAELLCRPSREASTHFVIGQDGTVLQLVLLEDTAWGNGIPVRPTWPAVARNGAVNPNRYTVSIEHAKLSADNSDALTSAQLDASLALVAWLLEELERSGLASPEMRAACRAGDLGAVVVGHQHIDSVTRAHCPGTWDWDGYHRRLRRRYAAPG